MTTILQHGLFFAAALTAGALLGSIGSAKQPLPETPTSPETTAAVPPPPTPAASLAALPNPELPSHYTSASGKERDLVARFWSRAAPADFLAHLASGDPPFFSEPAHALFLFDTWASTDFEAAFDAALGLSPFNPLRPHILHRVVAKKFPTHPAAAIASLENVWANNGSTVSHIVPYLDTPEQSLTHLARLPRTDVANSAMARCLGEWAKTDPAAALTWALEHHAPTSPVIIAAWGDDPAVAVGLLSRITSPRTRAKTAADLAVKNLRIDTPEISVALIDGYLDGWNRAETARKLVEKIAFQHPKKAAELSLTFKSANARSTALTASLAIFDRDAPQSLDHWLSSLTDSPSTTVIKSTVDRIRQPAAPPENSPPPSPVSESPR